MSKTTNIRIASGKLDAKTIRRERVEVRAHERILPERKSRNNIKAELRMLRFDEEDDA